jgi:hypothetical protein
MAPVQVQRHGRLIGRLKGIPSATMAVDIHESRKEPLSCRIDKLGPRPEGNVQAVLPAVAGSDNVDRFSLECDPGIFDDLSAGDHPRGVDESSRRIPDITLLRVVVALSGRCCEVFQNGP